jgi:acyl-coenzyme A synthetase/AMP-(fatty) acid ligase
MKSNQPNDDEVKYTSALAELLPISLEESIFYRKNRALSGDDLLYYSAILFSRLSPAHGSTKALVATDDTFALLVSLIALWCRGYAPVMPNGFLPKSIEAVGDYSYLLTDNQELVNLNLRNTQLIELENVQELEHFDLCVFQAKFDELLVDSRKLTITQMTSGSTGFPKSIIRSLDDLVKEAKALKDFISCKLDFVNNMIVAGTVALYHAYGLEFRFVLPLLLKMKHYCSALEYEEQLQKINDYSQSVYLVSSPGFLKRLHAHKLLSNPKIVLSAGGAISQEVIDCVSYSIGAPLFEIFGSTESGVMACRFAYNLNSRWQAPLGNSFYIYSDNKNFNHILKKQGIGRLAVLSSYVDKSLLKSLCTENGLERTVFLSDDIVELSLTGTIKLLGRQGRVLKFEDNRVSLDEIETILGAHEWIREAAVIAENYGHRDCIFAMLVLTPKGEQTYNSLGIGKFIISLRASLKTSLLPICIPRRIKIVNTIPLTATGKVAYVEVKRMFVDENS